MTESKTQQRAEPRDDAAGARYSQRRKYASPVLTAFGPMAMITGSNRAGSSWDAKFGDFVGKKQGVSTSLPSL